MEPVIPFALPDRSQREPIVRKKRDVLRPGCRHNLTEVDDQLRRVTCTTCKEVLDPIEVLIDICKHWEEYNAKAARIVELEKQIAEFERCERLRKRDQTVQLFTEEERKMTGSQLLDHHMKNGHPPDKIKLTANQMHCYCGCGWSRSYYRDMEAKVLAARQRRKKVRLSEVS